MPYCSSEHKMQGYEDEMEINVDSAEVSGDEVSVELTLNRLCAGCGSTSSTASLSISIPIEHECPVVHYELVEGTACGETTEGDSSTSPGEVTCVACREKAELEELPEREYEIDGFDEATGTDEYDSIDARGKPIPSRFQKRHLGAEISGSVKCSICNEEVELSGSDNMTASSFEIESH